MGDEALVRTLTALLVYVLVLLAAFGVVYVLLHRLTREEREARHGGARPPESSGHVDMKSQSPGPGHVLDRPADRDPRR